MRYLLRCLFLVISLLPGISLYAQPTNDECTNAINIPNVANFCSPVGAYTSVGATPSNLGPPFCWSAVSNDIWFSFKAVATDVTITIKGKTSSSSGGTLTDPDVALFFTNCTNFNELECQTAPNGTQIVEMYQSGLFVGTTYYIRVQGSNSGTFQVCINNYNPPVDPTSDCPTASLLCDKSPFAVQQLIGAGTNNLEMEGVPCFNGGAPGVNEMNSTWFKWICSKSGPLTFTLTPLNITDDLDFVVYKLPGGINNCNTKTVELCMASGSPSQACPTSCCGKTGLRAASNDKSEPPGCSGSQDNFIAPLNMVAGEAYALVVNNFSQSGNGFAIEFGGAGEFQGPEATFTTNPAAVCIGVPVVVTSTASFSIGSITSQKFSFGATAQPQIATGPGPHTVQFNDPGMQSVVMTVTTNLGCKVTQILDVTVFPKVEIDTFVAMPDCNGGTNGAVTITNIQSGTPPYLFSWNNGPFQASNTLNNLGVSSVNLVIKDANNCQTEIDIPVRELELTVAPIIVEPSCFGFSDGNVTLNVTNGVGPYQFNFGSGFQSSNMTSNLAAGPYTFLGTDAELCQGTFTVTVGEPTPLTMELDTSDITCYNTNNGIGIVIPGGGVGGYTYKWSDNQTDAEASNLAPGQYSVTLQDANGCELVGGVFLTQPPELILRILGTKGVLCFGDRTGTIYADGTGGVAPYQFGVDNANFGSSDTLLNVLGGDRWVMLVDANGCIDSARAYVPTPPPLIVSTGPDTTLQLGFTVNTTTFTSPIGRPVTYAWTPPTGLSCTDCPEPTAQGINDVTYILTITDEDGCTAVDSARIIVVKDRPLYIPNIIQPDNPQYYPNDKFTLFGGPAAERIESLRIYDRWGELVWEDFDLPLGADSGDGWPGTFRNKKVNPGVFAFVAKVRFVDKVVLEYGGDVTVKR
jgi:SprB repeat/CHU_C Type IX secretion signal domain